MRDGKRTDGGDLDVTRTLWYSRTLPLVLLPPLSFGVLAIVSLFICIRDRNPGDLLGSLILFTFSIPLFPIWFSLGIDGKLDPTEKLRSDSNFR